MKCNSDFNWKDSLKRSERNLREKKGGQAKRDKKLSRKKENAKKKKKILPTKFHQWQNGSLRIYPGPFFFLDGYG